MTCQWTELVNCVENCAAEAIDSQGLWWYEVADGGFTYYVQDESEFYVESEFIIEEGTNLLVLRSEEDLEIYHFAIGSYKGYRAIIGSSRDFVYPEYLTFIDKTAGDGYYDYTLQLSYGEAGKKIWGFYAVSDEVSNYSGVKINGNPMRTFTI